MSKYIHEKDDYLKAILVNIDNDIRELKKDVKKLFEETQELDKKHIRAESLKIRIESIMVDLDFIKKKIIGDGDKNPGLMYDVNRNKMSNISSDNKFKLIWKIISGIILTLLFLLIATGNMEEFYDKLLRMFRPF